MDFYLVRHGRVNSNDLKIYNGCRIDEDLNEEGIAQAELTREKLRDVPLDLIVSSPMLRARHTAETIAAGRNIPIIFDERLKERDMGELTGKPWLSAEEYERHAAENHAEPLAALCARVTAAIEDIRRNYPEKTVLLVSHGGASRGICAYFEGVPADGSVKSIRLLDNCEVRHYSV